MARATTTKTSARKSRTTASEAPPKRKPGRPVGSTKAKKAAPAAAPSRVTKTTAKRGPAPKAAAAAAAAPKMSKVDLEAHVSKLERTLSRLRDKNKELKQAATDAKEHADTLEEQLTARAAPASKPKSARKPSRSSSPPSTPDDEIESEATEL